MITLSATLLAVQKRQAKLAPPTPKLCKVILSRSGETTIGYDKSRIIHCPETFQPNSQKSDIILNNSDKALTPAGVPIDFESYQAVVSFGFDTRVARTAWVANTAYNLDDIRVPTTANRYQYRCAIAGTTHATDEPTWPTDLGVRVTDGTVTWEMDGDSGDEYSYDPPMKVMVSEYHSGRGLLRCILRCEGIPNQLKEDKAESAYTQTSNDNNTIKTLISAIAGATLAPYTAYTAITVTYDSEDSLIDTFKPRDYFSVSINDNRWDKIEELLDYTGCKWKIGNDGSIRIFAPTISGVTYDYEYKYKVSGDHTFLAKSVRLRVVEPNKWTVASHEDHVPSYSGTAYSIKSYDLDKKIKTLKRRLDSSAQAQAIAEALIEREELDAERGFATFPMNVGQEMWDYVKVTDARQGDTRVGNVQYIQKEFKKPEGNEGLTFTTAVAFGKASILSIMANAISAGGAGEVLKLSDAVITQRFNDLQSDLTILFKAHNELVDKWNAGVVDTWHIKVSAIAPVVNELLPKG